MPRRRLILDNVFCVHEYFYIRLLASFFKKIEVSLLMFLFLNSKIYGVIYVHMLLRDSFGSCRTIVRMDVFGFDFDGILLGSYWCLFDIIRDLIWIWIVKMTGFGTSLNGFLSLVVGTGCAKGTLSLSVWVLFNWFIYGDEYPWKMSKPFVTQLKC
jgi:hypothetical protein